MVVVGYQKGYPTPPQTHLDRRSRRRLGHKATTRFDVRREIGCPTAHNGEEEEKTGLTCLGLHSAAP